MGDIIVEGKILKWGNSFGIRIRKEDLVRLGLYEGASARIHVVGLPDKIDLGKIPTVRDVPDLSERHDFYYGQAMDALYRRKEAQWTRAAAKSGAANAKPKRRASPPKRKLKA